MGGKIEVRLKPSAKRNAIAVTGPSRIDAWVTSPPVDGRANAHLVKMLAKALGVPKSSCSVVRGLTSRNKVVDVAGLEAAAICDRLGNAVRKP
jgi:uncharacterized protein (TIGR00251 family)